MGHNFLTECIEVIERLINVVQADSFNRVAEPGALVLPCELVVQAQFVPYRLQNQMAVMKQRNLVEVGFVLRVYGD